jgi:hypothetical protein
MFNAEQLRHYQSSTESGGPRIGKIRRKIKRAAMENSFLPVFFPWGITGPAVGRYCH